MTGNEFAERRKNLGYKTRPQTAVSIGVKVITVRFWETDRRPVPKYAELWLERMEHQHGQKTGK